MTARPLELLIVEDDPHDVLALREMLDTMPDAGAWPVVNLHRTSSLSDAIGWLAANWADCILLDVGLPDSRGVNTVSAVHGEYPDVPIVVHSGQDELSFAIEAVRAGAQDVLLKGRVGAETVLRTVILSTWRTVSTAQGSPATMVDDVAVAACRLDADLRITQYNTAFAAMAPDAVVSQVITDYLEEGAILDMAGTVHRVTSHQELSETLDTSLQDGRGVCVQVIAAEATEATALFHLVPVPVEDPRDVADGRTAGYEPDERLRP
jgi:CheY-like chemotaxis protein